MEFTLELDGPFNLGYTLESGQAFRWSRKGEWWQGIILGGVVRVVQDGVVLRCVTSSDLLDGAAISRYFRLDDDIEPILVSIARDDLITQAVQKYYGLRIAQQDRWECLASFTLATNANIPRIKKMVSSICDRYGEPMTFEGNQFHTFPSAEVLAAAKVEDLVSCGLGYRAPFLKRVASSVVDGRVDLEGLSGLSYEEARRTLLSELQGEKVLLGVGPKVADCVLLYSCDLDQAFPIDVWVAREILNYYPALLGPSIAKRIRASGAKLGPGDYEKVSKRVREYFGEYAGYAQLYLFMYARERE